MIFMFGEILLFTAKFDFQSTQQNIVNTLREHVWGKKTLPVHT